MILLIPLSFVVLTIEFLSIVAQLYWIPYLLATRPLLDPLQPSQVQKLGPDSTAGLASPQRLCVCGTGRLISAWPEPAEQTELA